MSKILFIGPYRQRNLDGIWSRALINNIVADKRHIVQLRPLFIDSKYAIDDKDELIEEHENIKLQNYDTIIQHTNLSQASVINAIPKNILIPIITADIATNNMSQLSRFDAILVDNKHDSIRISSTHQILQKITKNIDYGFNLNASDITGLFDMGLLQSSHKLYMVLNYKLNTRLVYDIVVSFISNIKSRNISLILFTLDITAQEKTELENFIQEAYKKMGILHTISKIMVAPITSDLKNIYIAHRCGDAFIDAIEYGSNSINTKIATSLNKSIIKIDPDYNFSLTNSHSAINQNGSIKLSSEIIYTSIKRYIENKNIINNTSLFKTNHISKCI